jgi:transaldolase
VTPGATEIFADGADLDEIVALLDDPRVTGFTTNPTLMRAAGLTDYARFAKEVLDKVQTHAVSFEVCADDPLEIQRQARVVAGWGDNIYVKIPVTTTTGEPLLPLARHLGADGVKVNVTAVFTSAQALDAIQALDGCAPSLVSIFAGRIADAGVDPVPIVASAVNAAASAKGPRVLWASPREIYNLVQARQVGCHVITMTPDLLRKVDLLGKDLEEFSRETIEMFHRDAKVSGLVL